MISFSEKYKQLENDIINEQRKISLNSPLSIFYGVTADKLLRLSFISTIPPYELESTKEIRITQGKESQNVYWTCFDLLKEDAKEVFYTFCESLVESILDETEEAKALFKIKERYHSWQLLLKNKGKMPYEMYQGLYGELYFLLEVLAKKVSLEDAVSSWVGPDGFSKDFSIQNKWYEIKTIGTSSNSVKINSLAQLDSDVDGHLVIIVVEKMSNQYNNNFSCVHDLYITILNNLNNLILKEEFINKVLKYGYVDEDNSLNNNKFEVKSMKGYLVDKNFPKLTRNNINNPAFSNVTYEILIDSIKDFEEDVK